MVYVTVAGLVLVAVTALWLLRLFVEADPAKLAQRLRQLLLALAIAVSNTAVIFGFISERAPAVIAGIAGLGATWFVAAYGSRRGRRVAKSSPSLATDYLDLRLDQRTGAISGLVRRGRFQGRMLAELSKPELLALWRECCAGDEPGARQLETYFDRLLPGWRQESGDGGAAVAATMTRAEAYAVLGLEPGASDGDIEEAFRRLTRKNDPRRGGSTYLADQITQARKVLLRR